MAAAERGGAAEGRDRAGDAAASVHRVRTLVPAEADAVLRQEQREIAVDWRAAHARYMGGAH